MGTHSFSGSFSTFSARRPGTAVHVASTARKIVRPGLLSMDAPRSPNRSESQSRKTSRLCEIVSPQLLLL